MSGPTPETAEARAVITSKRQLVDYLAHGEKPPERWRIGTEHEKFPFLTDTLAPVPYDGPRSIKAARVVPSTYFMQKNACPSYSPTA